MVAAPGRDCASALSLLSVRSAGPSGPAFRRFRGWRYRPWCATLRGVADSDAPLDIAPSVPPDRVQWRVDGKPSGNRCRFVPYIDAATVADLLDEWVGPHNWRDRYEPHATRTGGLWCLLAVRHNGEWVTKRDVGVPSNFEGEKGAVSDAFKRAASLKWGVGRNVYELPTVWAPCSVRASNQGDQAYPNDQTMPAIQAELKRHGLAAVVGGVHQADQAPAVELTADQGAMVGRYTALPEAAQSKLDAWLFGETDGEPRLRDWSRLTDAMWERVGVQVERAERAESAAPAAEASPAAEAEPVAEFTRDSAIAAVRQLENGLTTEQFEDYTGMWQMQTFHATTELDELSDDDLRTVWLYLRDLPGRGP